MTLIFRRYIYASVLPVSSGPGNEKLPHLNPLPEGEERGVRQADPLFAEGYNNIVMNRSE